MRVDQGRRDEDLGALEKCQRMEGKREARRNVDEGSWVDPKVEIGEQGKRAKKMSQNDDDRLSNYVIS